MSAKLDTIVAEILDEDLRALHRTAEVPAAVLLQVQSIRRLSVIELCLNVLAKQAIAAPKGKKR